MKFIGVVWWKFKMILYILRGWPVAYRITINAGTLEVTNNSILVECFVMNSPGDGIRVVYK